MSKIPISVCIIAKNEEKHIENCLQKLLPYGFEIIVADTGSTDRTKQIAEKYADKVVDFAWIDDFSAERNFCAAQASNNWILALDCDEYVESADIRELRTIAQKCKKFLCVIRLKNLVYTEEGEKRYTNDEVHRFYNKTFFHYINPVHEQLRPIDNSINCENLPVIALPMEVIHYGYLITQEEMDRKQRRNLKLLYAALEKKPEDSYLHFQIGQSEALIGNYETACSHYETGLSQEPSPELLYVQLMIESLATLYSHTGQRSRVRELMEKYQNQCQTAKYAYIQANIYMDNAQPMKGLLYYLKAVTMRDVDTLGEELLTCYEKIIELYTWMGDEKMASLFQDKYQQCLAERERILGGAGEAINHLCSI